MKKRIIQTLVIGLALIAGKSLNAQITTTFDFTGDVQTYTIPVGVTSITIEAWGGQGQATTIDDFGSSSGGLGGYATGMLAVTPGDVLNIYVGGEGLEGEGGYNGGGAGGFATAGSGGTTGYGGSGGGASDIRIDGTTLTDRVIVAGGGGGGGRNYVNGTCVPCGIGEDGGVGGGLIGGDGEDPGTATSDVFLFAGAGGSGGTTTAGGAGGSGDEGTPGNPGTLGIGGDGIGASQGAGSGGGGGGFYGGGAGAGPGGGSGAAGGGGAGGSSYIDGVTLGMTTAGIRAGNGQITISHCAGLDITATATELCLGEELTLSATSLSGGSIVWTDIDVIDGVAFTPLTIGTTTYEVNSDADADCPGSIDITVNALPTVEGTASAEEICVGEELTLTGTGATTYDWGTEITDGVAFEPMGAGELSYIVEGIDDNGCTDLDTVDIVVNELPIVVANSDQEAYCEGDEIILTGEGADTYTWDLGVSDGVGFTQAIGTETYTVTGTNTEGCEAIATIDVTVNANPEITVSSTDELFGGDGTATVTIVSGIAPFEFDWDIDGSGDFDDDQNQTNLAGGTYTVTVVDSNGCRVSETVIVNSQLSIDQNEFTELNIYPNPTNGEIFINLNSAYTYALSTISGKVIQSGNSVNGNNLNLSDHENGIYLLTLKSEGSTITKKIVKN